MRKIVLCFTLLFMTTACSGNDINKDKTDVAVTLTSEELKAKEDAKIIINADVEITKDEVVVEDVSMTVNEPVTLKTKLGVGEYTISVTSAPIESDGSTYKIPDDIENIVITNEDIENNKPMDIAITLERIDVADMSKEQLKETIELISEKTPDENKELVEELKKRQEEATKVEEAPEVETAPKAEETPKADVPDAPKVEAPKVEETPKAETKPATKPSGNTNSPHEHNWVANMITIPAQPERWSTHITPGRTYEKSYFLWSDGCKVYASMEDERAKHDAKHGVMDFTWGKDTITEPEIVTKEITSPAQPERQEQRGYKCSCGATK